MIRLIVFIFFSLINLNAKAIIHNGDIKITNFPIAYLYDATKQLDINDIVHKNFNKQIDSQFTLGYIKGHSWFKIEIENQSELSQFVLYFTEPLFEEVNFYTKENNKWEKYEAGLLIPNKDKMINNYKPAFNLSIQKNETRTYYIQAFNKIGSNSEFIIYEKNIFFNYHYISELLLYMIYLGGLAIVIILNLFLYIKLEDRIYLYYVGYIFFYALFIFANSGISLYYGLIGFHYPLHFSPAMFIGFLLLFSKEFLDIKKYSRLLLKIFDLLIIVFFILGGLTLYSLDPWFGLTNSIATFSFIFLVVSAVYTLKKGHIKAKYYLMALCIYLITMALMSSVYDGWIENTNINRYSFIFGSYIEIIFFSLMLVERFNNIQKDKLIVQTELIKIKENKEIELQNEIQNRTKKSKVLLEEKELLLKEVYHRVKNNFQMLIGLIWIEENKIKDKAIKNIFPDFTSRITSMSLVHNLLYESDNLSQIDSNTYISNIISNIKRSSKDIPIEYHIEHIKLKMDDAISIGMIINEAISNSIKYNCNKTLKIQIKLYKEKEEIKLFIKDNGTGFDQDNSKKGLGLNLIDQFTNKLKNAKLQTTSSNGVCIYLKFEQNSEEIRYE